LHFDPLEVPELAGVLDISVVVLGSREVLRFCTSKAARARRVLPCLAFRGGGREPCTAVIELQPRCAWARHLPSLRPPCCTSTRLSVGVGGAFKRLGGDAEEQKGAEVQVL
jgi:hypothetical protein